MIEQVQDQDWMGIPHATFVIVYLYILVINLTRTLTFPGSLILYVRKVSVSSVSKILVNADTEPSYSLIQTQYTYKHK